MIVDLSPETSSITPAKVYYSHQNTGQWVVDRIGDLKCWALGLKEDQILHTQSDFYMSWFKVRKRTSHKHQLVIDLSHPKPYLQFNH